MTRILIEGSEEGMKVLNIQGDAANVVSLMIQTFPIILATYDTHDLDGVLKFFTERVRERYSILRGSDA